MGFTVHPLMRRLVLAATLAVGASGIARADDSSMNPFTGESYAAFNGGHNLSSNANPTFDQAPSVWRKANPDGLPERVLQSYSGWGEAWKVNQPVFASVASNPSFKQFHQAGLTEAELQALSSDAPAWQTGAVRGAALAAQDEAAVAQNTAQEPLGERIARFFHVARNGSAE